MRIHARGNQQTIRHAAEPARTADVRAETDSSSYTTAQLQVNNAEQSAYTSTSFSNERRTFLSKFEYEWRTFLSKFGFTQYLDAVLQQGVYLKDMVDNPCLRKSPPGAAHIDTCFLM